MRSTRTSARFRVWKVIPAYPPRHRRRRAAPSSGDQFPLGRCAESMAKFETGTFCDSMRSRSCSRSAVARVGPAVSSQARVKSSGKRAARAQAYPDFFRAKAPHPGSSGYESGPGARDGQGETRRVTDSRWNRMWKRSIRRFCSMASNCCSVVLRGSSAFATTSNLSSPDAIQRRAAVNHLHGCHGNCRCGRSGQDGWV